MTKNEEGKVGSKGEFFPSKQIRMAAGFKEHQKIKYSVVQGRIIIEKIPDPPKLISQPPKVSITWYNYKKNRPVLSKSIIPQLLYLNFQQQAIV